MAENNFTMAIDDTLMTQQYADTFRRSEHLDPERALVAAILDDAIHEYRKYSAAHDAFGKSRFREVEEWIMHGGNGWIFSFDNVCASLASTRSTFEADCVIGKVRQRRKNESRATGVNGRHDESGLSPLSANDG